MGPVEALKLALQKEIEAAQMYEKFSIEYPTAKETFIYLKGEEEKHKILIEKEITQMTKY
jgi:rubrerythrin